MLRYNRNVRLNVMLWPGGWQYRRRLLLLQVVRDARSERWRWNEPLPPTLLLLWKVA